MSELLQRRWRASVGVLGEGEVARMKSTQRLLTFIKKHLYVKKVKSTKWWIRKRSSRDNCREELDVNTDGRPVVDRSDRNLT